MQFRYFLILASSTLSCMSDEAPLIWGAISSRLIGSLFRIETPRSQASNSSSSTSSTLTQSTHTRSLVLDLALVREDYIRHYILTPQETVTVLTITRENLVACFTPEHLLTIARSFPHLTSLTLSGLGITPDIIALLVRRACFTQLTRLDVSDNPIGDESLIFLCSSLFAKQLTALNMSNTLLALSLKPHELAGVLGSGFPQLRELDVSGNVLTKPAMQFFKAPWLIQKLKILKTKRLSVSTNTHVLSISKQCESIEHHNNTCTLKSLKE